MVFIPLKRAIAVAFFASVALSSCDTEGCTDPAAGNFDPEADSDDNSCYYDAEPFLGSWIYLDSIQNNSIGFEFNEQRQMLILTSKTDRKNVKMVWTYPNAIVSDTLIAGSKPSTLTFDPQNFDDGFTFEGTFIYDEFFQRIDVNYTTVKNGAIEVHKGSAVLAD